MVFGMSFQIAAISPMVPTTDSAASVAFLENALGFTTKDFGDGYAICSRDGFQVHFLPAGADVGQMEFYVEVSDTDAVWTSMEPHVGGLKCKPPFDQPYGMREIHVELPATKCLMFLGSPVK